MNKQFENFINTYKNILKKKNTHDVRKILFFALQSIRSYDVNNFKPKQQIIINLLKSYYSNPRRDTEHELNNSITQYYIDDFDNEFNEEDENREIDVEFDDDDKDIGNEINVKLDEKQWEQRFPLDDVIRLEQYSIEKLLSLYNVALRPLLDSSITYTWLCEDQLKFSKPYKRVFIKQYIKKHGIIKCNTIVKIVMVSVNDKNKKIYPIFKTKYIIIRNGEDVDYFLKQSELDILSRIGQFTKKLNTRESSEIHQVSRSSGFIDFGIEYEKLNVVKIQNVFANGYIELPTRIIHTKSCINIKNKDDKCFLYCHLLHERYKINDFKKIQNPERLYGDKAFIYQDKLIHLDYTDIDFPIPFNTFYTVKKIEEQNKIRINLYEYKEDKKNDIVPIYHSKNEYKDCMNLLVISDKTKKKYHYVYIKNLNGLLKSNFKHIGSKFCESCLKTFSTQKAFNSINHKCKYKYDQTELPDYMAIVDNKLLKCPINMYVKPYNLKHSIHLPFVMYCDFESILKKSVDEKYHDKREHQLSSYCYNLVCRERPVFNRHKLYRGNDESVINNFLNEIKNVLDHIKECKKKFYSLPCLTDEQLKRHKKLKRCEICDVKFDKDIKRVQHHNHISGDYIATTCQSCNSKIRTDTTLYIVFHYLKGYDIHYIINKINYHFKDSNINLLGHNSSSIFHIDIDSSIKIIDSHEYIKGSLMSLSENLKDEDIIYTRELINKYGHDFVKKDIFPFRYIDDFSKYNENTFPDIKYFDNVNAQTYEKYRNFYETNFKTLGEYSDYYLEKDVRLLSDIMESYRTIFMEKYESEIFSHYSINSLTWEVMKKWCPIKIKILDNYKIYSAFESMARGGLCDIASIRYSCANNIYMENYDPNVESSYIMHFDINSMYGHIMRTYPMPYDEFSFLTNEEIRDFNIWDYNINSDHGFLLNINISEINIKYHDYYNDLPLCPVKETVLKKNISDYQKKILKENDKNFISSQKLICNFNEKQNYTLHYLTLQYYLKMPGFKVKQINYIIKFKQAKYLKDYIEYNHKNRIKSTNENDKNLYKLMINSSFGRTLLNKKKYCSNLKIFNDQDYDKVLKIISNDRFKDYEAIDENNAIINIEKQCIKLDSPSYIGSCILDLSKIIFYDNWYKLKNKYKDNISLMYYDTDSYLCHIKTEDIYKDMSMMNIFDMSSYNHDFKYYKQGVYEMGLLKDENSVYNSQIVEACALKSKLYGYIKENDKIKYKGIKNELDFQSLKNVVFNNEMIKSDFYTIKAKNHKIFSYTDHKTLIGYTDKRYLYNPVMSYAYGHFMIDKNYENMI